MSEPFIGEVRAFSFVFAPKNWATCDGQLINITDNQALFAVIYDTYGGNGRTNFALPDLRTSVMMDYGNHYYLGGKTGSWAVTLNENNLPSHTHQILVDDVDADQPTPAGNTLAKGMKVGGRGTLIPFSAYSNTQVANQNLSPQAIGSAGGNQPHENRQPYLALNFCMALQGLFPSRN